VLFFHLSAKLAPAQVVNGHLLRAAEIYSAHRACMRLHIALKVTDRGMVGGQDHASRLRRLRLLLLLLLLLLLPLPHLELFRVRCRIKLIVGIHLYNLDPWSMLLLLLLLLVHLPSRGNQCSRINIVIPDLHFNDCDGWFDRRRLGRLHDWLG
jgi:hypothetical protein